MFNGSSDTILLNIRYRVSREWKWSDMNNTLDRLKALNSRLEEKLNQKKKQVSLPEEKERTSSKTPSPTIRRKHETASSPHLSPLHLRLLESLAIDEMAEPVRSKNLLRLSELYVKLEMGKKVPEIENLFIYKAMNISGIGLKEEDFGEIREGKYVQVIAITYEPDKNGKKKAKNVSLGYFGKAETLLPIRKNEVIEFVLRWRYEKAFQNLEHYRGLLSKIIPAGENF